MTNGAKDGDAQGINIDEQQKKTATDEGANKEAEALKKELASRDKKIAELLEAEKARADEAEKQRQATLSTEEKLNELQGKLDRQDKLSNYLGMGLTQEQALTVVDAGSEVEKAGLIAKYSSEKAIESFKAEQLGRVNKDEPKPKVHTQPQDAFIAGMQKGMKA